jgi:hypothetical protein
VHVDFRLVREHGEWRIANPPPGLLLTPSELGRSLNQQFVYFLNRDLSVVVPDTVFLSASDPGLPTALMRVLLRGPTSWLVSAVRTAIPAGTTLRGPVTVDDRGTATVDLSQEVLDTTGAQREQLSAQIVWTLSGVPSITRVRLLAGGNPLNVPTVAEPQSRDAWPTFDPGALPPGSFGFYRNGSRVVSATGSRAPGWLDRHPTALADVAISPDLSFYAGLGPAGSGTTVYAGSIVADARPVFRASAPCTPPSWDEADDLWTVQLSPTPQVLLIRLGQPVVRVPAPELNGLAVRELRVSRDGTRVAVVASSGRGVELLVGRVSITGDGALRLDGFRSPSPGLLDVGDATWADANTVLVLARAPGHQRIPWLVDVDGVKPAPVTTSGLTSYTAAAGAPGQPTLVASGREIYQAKSGLWTPVGAGEDPGYPG